MNHYLDCKKIHTAITRAKKTLTKRAKKKGIYENFGQEEARGIRDAFVDPWDYCERMNRNRMILDEFNYWCTNFTEKDIEEYQ